MRQPPENSLAGRCWSAWEKPRPARISAARAGAECAPMSASRVWISAIRPASVAISASAIRAVRSRSALSTTSSKLAGPPGASWERRSMLPRAASSIRPCSGASSPAITRNRVVLPVPLRPTNPTRAPPGMCAEAPSMRRRPATRTERSSMTSIVLKTGPRLCRQFSSKRPPGQEKRSPGSHCEAGACTGRLGQESGLLADVDQDPLVEPIPGQDVPGLPAAAGLDRVAVGDRRGAEDAEAETESAVPEAMVPAVGGGGGERGGADHGGGGDGKNGLAKHGGLSCCPCDRHHTCTFVARGAQGVQTLCRAGLKVNGPDGARLEALRAGAARECYLFLRVAFGGGKNRTPLFLQMLYKPPPSIVHQLTPNGGRNLMSLERTFSIIKPNATARNL